MFDITIGLLCAYCSFTMCYYFESIHLKRERGREGERERKREGGGEREKERKGERNREWEKE